MKRGDLHADFGAGRLPAYVEILPAIPDGTQVTPR